MSESLSIEFPPRNERVSYGSGYLSASGLIVRGGKFVGIGGHIVRLDNRDIVSTGTLLEFDRGTPTSAWQLLFNIQLPSIDSGDYELVVTSFRSRPGSINSAIWEETVARKFSLIRDNANGLVLKISSLLGDAAATYFTISDQVIKVTKPGAGYDRRLSGNYADGHTPTTVTMTNSHGTSYSAKTISTTPESFSDTVGAEYVPGWFADFSSADITPGDYTAYVDCSHSNGATKAVTVKA